MQGGINIKSLEQNRYWIWLSLVEGLGSRRKQILLKMYQTPEKIYQLEKADILKLKGFNETLADRIVNKENKQHIDSK